MFSSGEIPDDEHQFIMRLLQYRDKFCRLCLNPAEVNGSLISIDMQIGNLTLLDMFIQLTAFETEENIAYPRVVCLQCKHKLVRAFNHQQEFIVQTEHLVQLTAKQKIMSYYEEYFNDETEVTDTEEPQDATSTINEHLNDHSSYVKSFDDFDAYCREKQEATEQKKKARVEREKNRAKERYVESKTKKIPIKLGDEFPPTTCYICNKQHDTIKQRDHHLQEHISMLPYQCNECINFTNSAADKKLLVLKSTAQLNQHFKMHSMPHKCSLCYHKFSSIQNLKTHLWSTHKNTEDGLTCEYCGKQYFHKRQFYVHLAKHRHKSTGQFKCTICERSFGNNVLLQRHMPMHTGEKKFKCNYCDRSFSRSCNRLTHQKIHTGEKLRKCPDCDLVFLDLYQLNKHRKGQHGTSHVQLAPRQRFAFTIDESGTKHYQCQFEGCYFTTVKAQKMSSHKANHIRGFECDECGKRFSQPNRVRSHKLSVHSGANKKKNQANIAAVKEDNVQLEPDSCEWDKQESVIEFIVYP